MPGQHLPSALKSPPGFIFRFILSVLFIAILPVFSSAAGDKTENAAPERRHLLAQSSSQPVPAHQQALPEPAGAPEGELPPVAPPLEHRPVMPEASHSPTTFNLQAQQDEMRIPRGSLMQEPLSGQFAQPPWQSSQPSWQRGSARNDRLESENAASPRALTQVDLKKLADHEVVLLVDRSGSMSTMDCPTGNSPAGKLSLIPALLGIPLLSSSRWNWCLQQTAEMSRQTESIYNRGITVVLFSTGYRSFQNVTLDRLPQIFGQNYPMGSTNLAEPLAVEIGEYFRRRALSRENVKPLIIGIITDGCPTNRGAVVEAIVGATQLMHDPQEVTVIFFLIGGMDMIGERFVHDLSVNLTSRGARYPIVREVSFGELQQVGLAKAIARNLQ